MSNIHVLNQDKKKKGTRVIFHVAVPIGNNSVDTPWNQCVREFIQPTSVLAEIPANSEERAAIINGDILEDVVFVRYNGTSDTPAQKLAKIQADYIEHSGEVKADLAIELENWGKKA